MIQLQNKIGFSGKMTSGKTTISNLLAEKYGYEVLPIGGRIKKVCNLLIEDADRVYAYLEQILPEETLKKGEHPVEKTFDTLNLLLDENFAKSISKLGKENVFIKNDKGIYQKNEFYRDLTQKVGTGVRRIFGEQIWVQVMLKEADYLIEQGKKVICDDVRLEVEYDMFSKKRYELIRLDVNSDIQKERIINLYRTFDEKALVHPTETALDETKFKNRFNTSFESKEETLKKVQKIIAA